MADTFSKEKRSDIMRRVKSFNTKPEQIVRKNLHKLGFRFTLHSKRLPGRPDIVLPKYKVVININGCFWHGHVDCKRSVLPKANDQYWKDKIEKNKNRDKSNNQKLNQLGWRVITIFECELKLKNIPDTISRIINEINAPKTNNLN